MSATDDPLLLPPERVTVSQPVRFLPGEKKQPVPKPGMALCLSGGGYRAMVFHLGALIRLNELGLLGRLARISSVSGGSITAAMLGLKWGKLRFRKDGFAEGLMAEVIDPVRKLAGVTIDAGAVLIGALPVKTASKQIAKSYAKHLFGDATLQDLPFPKKAPLFVINATNVQSGVLWRFTRPYMGDYLVGRIMRPKFSLADAVAASSAFPPVLSPAIFELDSSLFKKDPGCPLQREPFTSRVVLSDGGVYDNLGLETAWKSLRTVFVSDAGAKIAPEDEPKEDWARHAYRVLDMVDNQVRSLRKRQIIEAFKSDTKLHDGTYWGIRTAIAHYRLSNALPCPPDRTADLARIPTRLKAMNDKLQERLINWGYAVCDAALRKHAADHLPKPPPPRAWPYPQSVP